MGRQAAQEDRRIFTVGPAHEWEHLQGTLYPLAISTCSRARSGVQHVTIPTRRCTPHVADPWTGWTFRFGLCVEPEGASMFDLCLLRARPSFFEILSPKGSSDGLHGRTIALDHQGPRILGDDFDGAEDGHVILERSKHHDATTRF